MNSENMPLVSVVIPCYNHGEYVATAIESILNQTYKNIELIVADNGSTDNSYEVIKQYEDKLKKIIRLEKNDCYKCDLLLIAEAEGQYFSKMTADDYWEPDKLEQQMDILMSHPNIKACSTWALFADENLRVLDDQSENFFLVDNRSRGDWLKRFIQKGTCLAIPSAVFEMDLARRVRTKYKGYSQTSDLQLWMQVLLESDIYVVQKPLMIFRWHTTGANRNVSAPTEDNINRACLERAETLEWLMEEITDEFFVEIFQDEFVHPDANTHEELMCEKFLLLLKWSEENKDYQSVVWRFYYNHFVSDEGDYFCGLSAVLADKYGYFYSDFVEWNKNAGWRSTCVKMKKAIHKSSDRMTRLKELLYARMDENDNIQSALYQTLEPETQEMIEMVNGSLKSICDCEVYVREKEGTYEAVVNALEQIDQYINMLWNDLKYLELGIEDEEWKLFEELLHYAGQQKIDLSECVFPFLREMNEKIDKCLC